jgi:hypothetical protein
MTNVYRCHATFKGGDEYNYVVEAMDTDIADRAFQQYVYEKRYMTKAVATKWSIEEQ